MDEDQAVKDWAPSPASLDRLIIDYHRAHSNSLRLAHHVGHSTSAARLAEYFDHVHVSRSSDDDDDDGGAAAVRQWLGALFQQNWWKGRFTFSSVAAGALDAPFLDGSVDCVALLHGAAHVRDQDQLVRASARSLAPNGTLAVVHVHPVPRVLGNEPRAQAVRLLYAAWASNLYTLEEEATRQELSQLNAGPECIPLPDGLFIQDVTKRIQINVRGHGPSPFALPGKEEITATSRAAASHRRYEFTSEDAEGEGWRLEVERGWFRRDLKRKTGSLERERLEGAIRRVEESIPDAELTTIEWTVGVLLATRK